ncbi:MAG: hypothetical protein GY926_16325 [bacterium]|nr:hypothetical protein [bacterium]
MTMPQSLGLDAMATTAGRAVTAASGIEVTVGAIAPVPLDAAFGVAGTVAKQSTVVDGAQTAGLITIVPSSGLVSAEGSLDAAQLADALVQGAIAGVAQAGGPLLQFAGSEPLPPGADVTGEAFGFDLTAGARSITITWVVEATLGSLLGGSIPVDGPPGGPSVAPATLPELSRASAGGAQHDLSILSDVATNVTVEIARGSVRVRDLTTMTPGTVFELDRVAGDPVDILVNGMIVARGDIVVVGNQLGIEIAEIVEPKQ